MTIQKFFERTVALVPVCALLCFPVENVLAKDEQAMEILRGMSAKITSLDQFMISGDGYVDARLAAGQIIEHSMDVTMRMNRPNAMRITNHDAEAIREIYYDEGVLTVYSQANNFYAQHELPSGTDAAAKFAVNELGIDAPMLDFVANDVADHLLKDAQSVDYLGLSRFRGMTYHHIGIRSAEIDLQVWVAAEGSPLPGKMTISSKWEGGSPRSVFFFKWDTEPDFSANPFSFAPPEGAIQIEFDLEPGK
jgi:hypothetical protein